MTFANPDDAASHANHHQLPFPVLVDPDRSTYQAYGLGRATFAKVWNLAVARRYFEILRSNGLSGLARPTEDTRQLGGDFIIDTDGTLAYGHWSEGPADRPSVDELAAVLESLAL